MRESPYPMIAFDEAVREVLRRAAPLPVVERAFEQAAGQVMATAVRASEPLPPFPASTVDGFAVRAAEGAGWRRLAGEQFAGNAALGRLEAGEAARITTGAPVPSGADAVMMVEWSEEAEGRVRFDRSVAAGDFIRPVGSDIARGQVVVAPGTVIGPAEIGLLATIGATRVQVTRRPVLGVMSTGDELVEPHERPGPGQIRDANRFSLMAAARASGAEVVDLGVAPDEWARLEAYVDAGRQRCDLLLSSGGVSMGERDLVKPLLAQRGQIHFGRVRVRPGKPVTFATLERSLFFALPGNPVSSLVCFELFVRPALRRMAGYPDDRLMRPVVPARLSHDIAHAPDRTEFQRAVVHFDRESGYFVARTTGGQQSSRLLSMAGANALIRLPHSFPDPPAGTVVEAWLLD